MKPMAHLGVGIGWRPEIAGAVESLPGLDWVEVVAENICPGHLPESLERLLARGVRVVPHGVSLGIGGADRPDPAKLAALGERAVALGAPLVTEHIAFVRTSSVAPGPVLEAGHLLPVARTRDALDVLCENVRIAQDALPVPLALENIAALVSWPGEELTEAQFLTELVERTGVRLLIDVANLHTNRVNRGRTRSPCWTGSRWRRWRTCTSPGAWSGVGCGTTRTRIRAGRGAGGVGGAPVPRGSARGAAGAGRRLSV